MSEQCKFRKWANGIVKDYTIKGWVMDDERLKMVDQCLQQNILIVCLSRFVRSVCLSVDSIRR